MNNMRVGLPLVPGVPSFQEGVHYNYTVGGHTLFIGMAEPSEAQIQAIQRGQVLFALTRKETAIFVLTRFGDLAWTATPYNWWINAPVIRPDPWDDMAQLQGGLRASVCLVNTLDGVVAALRIITLPKEISHLFMDMVKEQMRPPFDPWRYLEVVEETFKGNPDLKMLLRDASCMCVANFSRWEPLVTPSTAMIH